MQREEALHRLSAHRDDLPALGVRWIALFGSTARGDARPDSDVDLLVDLEHPMGLFALARLQRQLETWVGARVDLVPCDSLKPDSSEAILREAIRVS